MKTQKVQRENLAEIYENVCGGWQDKINTLLNANQFSSEIEVPNDLILKAYRSADKDVQKKWLAKHLPKPKSIIDEVNSYEDACNILGIKPRTLKEFETFCGKEKAKRLYSRHKISTLYEALNEGWMPNWDNDNQRKYYIWKYNKNNGFGFAVCYDHYFSRVGSDLYGKSDEVCRKVHDILEEDIKIYLF